MHHGATASLDPWPGSDVADGEVVSGVGDVVLQLTTTSVSQGLKEHKRRHVAYVGWILT